MVLLVAYIAALAVAEEVKSVGLEGLRKPVDIHYDDYGVPHIFGTSWSDAYRALGYVHALDRLWQMELFRRRASGTNPARPQMPGNSQGSSLIANPGARPGAKVGTRTLIL